MTQPPAKCSFLRIISNKIVLCYFESNKVEEKTARKFYVSNSRIHVDTLWKFLKNFITIFLNLESHKPDMKIFDDHIQPRKYKKPIPCSFFKLWSNRKNPYPTAGSLLTQVAVYIVVWPIWMENLFDNRKITIIKINYSIELWTGAHDISDKGNYFLFIV